MDVNRRKITLTIFVVVFLAIHCGMVVWLAAKQSPNVDELAHLASGMAIWQYGSFENYCVNPPLMRAVATLPIHRTFLVSPCKRMRKQWTMRIVSDRTCSTSLCCKNTPNSSSRIFSGKVVIEPSTELCSFAGTLNFRRSRGRLRSTLPHGYTPIALCNTSYTVMPLHHYAMVTLLTRSTTTPSNGVRIHSRRST